METSSIVFDNGKESFDLSKCTICQKSGFLVSTGNGRIRIFELAYGHNVCIKRIANATNIMSIRVSE